MNAIAVCSTCLLAALPTTVPRVSYAFSRLRDFSQPELPLVAAALIVLALVGWAGFLYRRDCDDLHPLIGWSLFLLRCLAVAGLLLYFLRLEKRTTREIVHTSQVAILADVSQSMGLPAGDARSGDASTTRADEIIREFSSGPLLEELCLAHDVSIVRFDQDIERLATLKKRTTDSATPADDAPDWQTELAPRGTESRLGDALDKQLAEFSGAPLAAVILLSDGAQNAGIEPTTAAELFQNINVPVFTVGFGSTRARRNVSVTDLSAPLRAFPGDLMTVTAYLQADGYAGRLVDLELTRRPEQTEPAASMRIASERVALGEDGEVVAVPFEIDPLETGTFIYEARLVPPADDDIASDNSQEVEVHVVDRQTRVLLFAGGPARDYRFLRNLLFRDASVELDVLLQTSTPAASQEADRFLTEFPSSKETLYEYDCIVAIDPDWTQLDALQLDLLESWIATEAGGLIAVAGPIHTARWIRSTEHARLRNLYPVEFQPRLTLLDDGHYAGNTAWPIELERAGRESRIWWLENSAAENADAWDRFAGVFGYYGVKGAKLGSTVYGRFSDPQASLGAEQPVYLADHLYGAGRVLYIGSAELWRLRMVDQAYFDTLYTQLIRHVGQGRIQRGSSRGALLIERDRYELGETVVVRARLTDQQHEPLLIPSVTLQVLQPNGTPQTVKLSASVNQPGFYIGQFTAHHEGPHQLVLSAAGGLEDQLSRRIRVRMPDLERAHPRRNETLLAEVATLSGGRYYPELELATRGDANVTRLAQRIDDQSELKLIEGAPDEEFARRQMLVLLTLICGALLAEWTLRRLARLA